MGSLNFRTSLVNKPCRNFTVSGPRNRTTDRESSFEALGPAVSRLWEEKERYAVDLANRRQGLKRCIVCLFCVMWLKLWKSRVGLVMKELWTMVIVMVTVVPCEDEGGWHVSSEVVLGFFATCIRGKVCLLILVVTGKKEKKCGFKISLLGVRWKFWARLVALKPHSERMKLGHGHGHGLFYIFTTRANCNFLSFSDSLFIYFFFFFLYHKG